MLIAWFLVGLAAGLIAGAACTYVYLDNKFQKAVKEVLDGIRDELARFADE